MSIDVQFMLRKNPNYIKYLRENSYWYKILTRNPLSFKSFEEEVKKNYKLRTVDKISDAIKMVNMIQSIMNMK